MESLSRMLDRQPSEQIYACSPVPTSGVVMIFRLSIKFTICRKKFFLELLILMCSIYKHFFLNIARDIFEHVSAIGK